MPDKRLIDANALLEDHRCRLTQNTIKVENGDMTKPYSNFEAAIMECLDEYLSSAPTIDAVELVRCRECAGRKKNKFCIEWLKYVPDDGFCHMGAKMDGGEPHEENPHTL